jgi:uncharacterized protein (TIGR02302 family)
MDPNPSPIPTSPGTPDPVRRRLDRLVLWSRAVLLWEFVWPRAWGPLAVLFTFLAASWLGLWLDLTPTLRQAGLALFAIALIASLWPMLRLRVPGRPAALDRIDRGSAEGHRPARTLNDTLALGTEDPGARLLWALHLRRAEAAVTRLRVTAPRPGMVRRDPFALRAAGLLVVIASAFVAGPEIGDRLRAAFDWRGPGAPAPLFRVDGWIDPPLYTRLPPLMIDLAAGDQRLKAPVNATLVIRIAGQGDASLSPGAGLTPLPPPEGEKPDLREKRFKLTGSSDIAIRTGLTGHFRLAVEAIPDTPPEIAFSAPPEEAARGTFTLAYKARDDYGIASAEALVTKPDALSGRRSLVPAPTVALGLPADPHANDETKTVADLSEHPWAGARVKLVLVARDEAEQEGRSAPVDFTLPQRPFTQPLARALVEQRRNLVLDPDHRRPVQIALDALLIAPERYTPAWGVFLGLRSASERLRAARSDADLIGVADWLWTMALQIEEGDLTDAERQLRAAQDKLQEAMERGASNEEIRRLTQELKQAMGRFLREFAQRMERDHQAGRQQQTPDRVISQNDLNRMLNDMQEAMKRGDTAEAQRLLDQLKNILENLRTAQPGNRMSDPAAREMSRQMDELDRLTREEQQLRDETFKNGQQKRNQRGQRQQNGQQQGQRGGGQRQPGQQGQNQEGGEDEGEEGQKGQSQQGGKSLAERQGALRDRLAEMQRRMRGLGMKGEQGLADAEGAMKDAEGALGQGQEGQAVDSQGRALEGLQRGMQGMAQQMQQMMGQGENGDQDGDPNGPGNPQGRAQNDPRSDDPLGRPTRSREFSDGRVRVPGANESAVERARRILEELRRKLGDPSRPTEELDYFERLLKQQN